MPDPRPAKSAPAVSTEGGGENDDKKKKPPPEDELSEEDKQKKADIDLMVERISDVEFGVQKLALESLANELRTATSSMTSVPKPLRFLRPHFADLETVFELMLPENSNKGMLAEIMSVVSTTIGADERKCLKYRLLGSGSPIASWGTEYMKALSGEIGAEFNHRVQEGIETDELMKLVKEIVPYYMSHNAETEAVDLLCEVDDVEALLKLVDENSFQRVCTYLISVASLAGTQKEMNRQLMVIYRIFLNQGKFVEAMRIALKFQDCELITEVLRACPREEDDKSSKKIPSNNVMRKQMAVIAARQPLPSDYDWDGDTELQELAYGEFLTTQFSYLAKELSMEEPKMPEDVYKTHLEERTSHGGKHGLDSAQLNVASTIVNGFVNAGFSSDGLLTVGGSDWLTRNKEHGVTLAAASVGLVYLWNVAEGLTQIDRYQWSTDTGVKAGTMMAFGLVSAGVRGENDAAFAILSEPLEGKGPERLGAILGLGYAYAGSGREDILEALVPIIVDSSCTLETNVMAAITASLVHVGTCNESAAEALMQALMDREQLDGGLDGPLPVFFAVSLGLLFLGKRDACEAVLEALQAVAHPVGRYAEVCVEGFAYAGTGDVLKVQRMLQICTRPAEESASSGDKPAAKSSAKESPTDNVQAAAALCIPLIAMGEEIGSEMVLRMVDHFLQYSDTRIRRAVPLMLALKSLGNPRPVVIDTLSKLSHDADSDVALHAIIGMGMVGAGTNNARIAGLLRQLAAFYSKDADAIFTIRLTQGLLYMGKGLISISPIHSDRFLLHPAAIGSLMVVFHSLLNLTSLILKRYTYLLLHLAPAMYPRFMTAVDEDMKPVAVLVRVGKAVDVVGQAGKPKSVTGFQTHTTPVVLSYEDRVELASDEWIPATTILEGVVIVTKNPDFDAEGKDGKR